MGGTQKKQKNNKFWRKPSMLEQRRDTGSVQKGFFNPSGHEYFTSFGKARGLKVLAVNSLSLFAAIIAPAEIWAPARPEFVEGLFS